MAVAEPQTTPSPLSLTLFGPFEVRVAGELVPPLRTRKGYRLLALLALRSPREVERTWLAGMLWPDSPESQAFANLRNTLKDLRHALGAEASRLCSPSPRTLSLDPEGTAIDVIQFDQAISTGDTTSLEWAVALYRGPLLEGWNDEWAFEERQVREQACVAALERLADESLTAGDPATAERHLRRVVTIDPLRESAHRALMQALAAGGNYAAVIQVYRELRLLLHREINAEPDPETQHLYQQLRAEARTRSTRRLADRHQPVDVGAAAEDSRETVDELSIAEPSLDEMPDTPPPPPRDLPSGTVTFLFTDIEGSTRLWEEQPEAMREALARHDALLRETIEANGGVVFKTVGDQFCAAFASAADALAAAVAGQLALVQGWERCPSPVSPRLDPCLKVRMALHAGAVEERGGDYFGPAVNRVARLLSGGHGGQILLSQAAADLGRQRLPPGSQLRDLGQHQLRDLIEPERIFQLVASDLPHDFPPLQTHERRHNLPAQRSALVGREREIAAVRELLLREEVGLVTLTGPSGTGKSRLALQVATELLAAFGDGVFVVLLASIRDANLVASEIAQALDVRESSGHTLRASLEEYLRDRQLLLLLDNFEQLLAAAPLVADLLAAAPQLKILVTSRAALRVRGEHEFEVPSLAVPPPAVSRQRRTRNGAAEIDLTTETGSPIPLLQYASVELFIQLAQSVNPQFTVTPESLPAIAAICRRLEGLPLSIELAATRTKLLSPAALLARLESRLKLLTGGPRDLPDRQQTLRGAIAWSYDLLEEAQQILFRRLSVFVGGFTLEAAEALCSDARGLDLLDGLASLADHSLLKREELEEVETRFVMLETLREFGAECLAASGEEASLQSTHARYFLEQAEAAEPQLLGPEAAGWLALLEREHDNLRAALTWALAHKDTEIGLRLGAALWRFWYVRGYLREGWARLEAALALPEEAPASRARARALNAAGSLAHELDDLDRAGRLHQESLAIAQALAEPEIVAYALLGLGNVAMNRENHREAQRLYEESLTLWRELGSSHFVATLLDSLGQAVLGLNQPEAATALMEESLTLKRQLGNPYHIAISLNNLAYVAIVQGQHGRAARLLLESLELFQQLGNSTWVAESLSSLARLAVAQGDLERAACLLAKVRSLSSAIDAPVPGDYQQILIAAHTGLDEEEFETAWSRGETMTLDEVIAF